MVDQIALLSSGQDISHRLRKKCLSGRRQASDFIEEVQISALFGKIPWRIFSTRRAVRVLSEEIAASVDWANPLISWWAL